MTTETLDYHNNTQDYYGRVLQTNKDLKTSACCENASPPAWLKPLFQNLDGEIIERSYGCGSPIPTALEGQTVLDLGCGTGRDVFLASQLVGQNGKVIGVDFTDEQLEVARRHRDSQMERFGFKTPNVEFLQGPLEDLHALRIADESIDVVISNCVLNLCRDKADVISEVFRVLKPGGELYFSDVFASRRLPIHLANDPDFHGECLGGAWYWEDFRRLLLKEGCPDYRVVSQSKINLEDPRMAALSDGITFESATVRCFKIASLEDRCEDYGQVVTYKGTIPQHPRVFPLDPGHLFEKGRPERVCGNSAAMIEETRFARHFSTTGDRSHHFGLFPGCEPAATEEGSGCC
ncbi:MAG: methyltransferase domain-containing protein [Verrucomicrobiota bacterium]